jgi:hypothetical protein
VLSVLTENPIRVEKLFQIQDVN